jgi:non-heme chloroperoxidase
MCLAELRRKLVPTITTRDGTEIFYKDWGTGRPVVFSHGWPLNADAWDEQAFFVASHGYRAIAHDRRGHGRSSQPWGGNDMDHYADDLAELIGALDLHDAVLVGHSTGGGEIARYLGRHGSVRAGGAILVGAVPPLMVKTDANPGGTPIEAFDAIRDGLAKDRSQFYRDLSAPFYGANRTGAAVSQGLRDSFWLMSMQVGFKAAYDCVKAFSETDFTQDLKKIDVPVLLVHGDDDQIVPLDDSSRLSAQLISNATLKIYPGAPHGLANTTSYRDTLNNDLLTFIGN